MHDLCWVVDAKHCCLEKMGDDSLKVVAVVVEALLALLLLSSSLLFFVKIVIVFHLRSRENKMTVFHIIKKRFLQACVTCISHDGELAIKAYELTRAIASCLDCPMPPVFVDG